MPLNCPPDNTTKALLFQCDALAVTQGTETLGKISLKDIFVPVDSFYQGNIFLPSSTITQISHGNVSDETSEVKFLCISPDLSVVPDLDEQVLTWAWLSEDPDFSWNPLGAMMILTGNDTIGVEPIVISNPWEVNVPVRIFIGV